MIEDALQPNGAGSDPEPFRAELLPDSAHEGNGERPGSGSAGPVNDTGTTTLGIATDDGVVIATDTRASMGGRLVTNKDVQKVEQIHPTAALTLVGSVGGAQSLIRTLRSEASLYETRRGAPLDIPALATFAGNLARAGPYRAVHPVLGGVDDEGSHVYSIDPGGGVMADEYVVTGSGTQLAYGTLESEYDAGLSIEEARQLAARSVESAIERDTGSGNGVYLAEVTADGVEIEGHRAFDELV